MRATSPLIYLVALALPSSVLADSFDDDLALIGKGDLIERLAAEKRILERGPEAIPRLKRMAETSEDPELQRASSELIDRIQWQGIAPETVRKAKAFLKAPGDEIAEIFGALCREPGGLELALLLLDRMEHEGQPEEVVAEMCRTFLKNFISSEWTDDLDAYLALSPLVKASLLKGLLSEHPTEFELASEWWCAAELPLSTLDDWEPLIKTRSAWVIACLQLHILEGRTGKALDFARRCSAISHLHTDAWADLHLKIEGAKAPVPKNLTSEQSIALLRAMGQAPEALKRAKKLAADHPLRVALEELHGDLADFNRHAEQAPEFSTLKGPFHQQVLKFLKDGAKNPNLESFCNSQQSDWFTDLERLATLGDYQEILNQTKDYPDRLPYWIEAAALSGNHDEILGQLKDPSKLTVRSCIAGADYLNSQNNQQAAKDLLTQKAADLDPIDQVGRHQLASALINMGAREQAFRIIPVASKDNYLRECAALFPGKADEASFWAARLSSVKLEQLWQRTHELLEGQIPEEKANDWLEKAHRVDEFGLEEVLACFALVENRKEKSFQTQRWAETLLLLKILQTNTETEGAVERLITETRYRSTLGEHDRAIRCIEQALIISSSSPELHLEHSLVLASAGKIDASRTAATKAGLLTLGRPQAYLAMSRVFEARGMRREATQAIQTLLRFGKVDNAASARAIRLHSYQLAAQKKYDRALQLRALELIKVASGPAKFRSLGQYATLSREYRDWLSKARK